MENLVVQSGQGNYSVKFVPSVETLGLELEKDPPSVIVIDQKVAGLYQKALADLLNAFPVLQLTATEDEKTLQGVDKVYAFLVKNQCNRQSSILTIGGGIIQDIVAFAAHTYFRGIHWRFVPTTLLSMSDSCIGAKFGVNYQGFKNQIGGFHSPSEILICSAFLPTLSDRDVRSGYGEIAKLLLIGSQDLFDDFIRALDSTPLLIPSIDLFIYHSLKVKQSVIEVDEYEKNWRRILNYGHTFGHALESWAEYEIPHGLAVAWGMDLVNYLAIKMDLLDPETELSIHIALDRHFHYHLSQPIDAAHLVNAVRRDKKADSRAINLAVLRRPGQLEVIPVPIDDHLTNLVAEYLVERHMVDWR